MKTTPDHIDHEKLHKLQDEYMGVQLNARGNYIHDIYHGYPYGNGGVIEIRNLADNVIYNTVYFADLADAEVKLEALVNNVPTSE